MPRTDARAYKAGAALRCVTDDEPPVNCFQDALLAFAEKCDPGTLT